MSTTVDNRVVEMEFDNDQFEKGVHQTLGTLEQLKQSLEFENSSLSGIESDLDTLTSRFSNMGVVGLTVLQDLTREAERMATAIVKDIALDPITTGWQKYADKTTAVQTVMAATADQFDDTGKQMEYVNGQLEKLNWFTDETSYNFVDMVGNIGKFTASGVKLDDAVTAMIGIANWAAVSGQNAQTASRAMYQLSQAMGSGVIKLMDWRSIINANMATVEFKNTVLETAASMGTLEKAADGTYKTLNGNLVDTISFAEHLTDDEWFTGDVLIGALDKYGRFTNELYDISQEAENASKTTSELIAELEKGGQVTDQFGLKAFRTAQEAKTFAEAIDSVKDAASTGWMTLYEDVFGDYLSAKKIWTELANYLWDVFVGPIAKVHELLVEWIGKGGRDAFIEALESIGPAVNNILAPLAGAWNNVFTFDGSGLVRFSENLRDFIQSIRWTDEEVHGLQIIFEGVFMVIKKGFQIVEGILDVASKGLQIVFRVAQKIFDLGVKGIEWLNNLIERISEVARNSESFQRTLETFGMIFGGIYEGLSEIWEALNNFIVETGILEFVQNTFSKVFTSIADTVVNITDTLLNFPDKVRGAIERFLDTFFGIQVKLPTITDIFMAMAGAIQKVVELVEKAAVKVKELGNNFKPIIDQFLPNLIKILKKAKILGGRILTYFGAGLKMIGPAIKLTLDIVKTAINTVLDMFTTLVSAITGEDYSGFVSALKGVFGSLFDVIVGIYESVRNVIVGIFDTISNSGLKITGWERLKEILLRLKEDLAPLENSLSATGEAISNFFDRIFGIDTTPGERIVLFFEKLGKAVTGVFGGIILFGQKLIDVLKNLFMKLYDFLGQPTLAELISMFGTLSKALLDLSLIKTAKGLAKTFDELSNTFGTFQKKIAANNMLNIAKALLVLAGSMIIMSLIPDDALMRSLGAITLLTLLLGMLMKLLTSISSGFSGLKDTASSSKNMAILLLGLSISVIVLADAVKKLDGIGNLGESVTGVLALMTAVTALMYFLTNVKLKSRQLKTVFGYILTVAAIVEGVKTLMDVVAELATLPIGAMLASCAGVVVVMGALTGLLAVVNKLLQNAQKSKVKGDSFKSIAATISAMGTALLMIAGATKIISTIPVNDLLVSMLVISGFMLLLQAFIRGIAKVDTKSISGLTGMGSELAKVSRSFITFGIGLMVLAGALAIFSKVPWNGMLKGLAAVSGLMVLLLGFGVLLNIFPTLALGITTFSGAIFKFGVGLLAVVLAMQLFISLTTIMASSFGTIAAGATVLLTAIVTALMSAMPMLLELIRQFIAGTIQSIIDSASLIINAIVAVIDIIGQHAMELGYKLGMIIAGIVYGIADALPAIIDAAMYCIIMVINGLAEAIRGNSGALIDSILNLVSSLLELVISAIGELLNMFGIPTKWVDKVNGKIENFFKGTDFKEPAKHFEKEVQDSFESVDVSESTGMLGSKVTSSLNNQFTEDDGQNAVEPLTTGMNNYLGSEQAVSDSGIDQLGTNLLGGFNSSILGEDGTGGVSESGFNFISGFANSLTSNQGTAIDAASNLGANSLESFNDILGIKSPSTETGKSGHNFVIGFTNEIDKSHSDVRTSIKKMADVALETLRSHVSKFQQVGKDCASGFAQGLRNNVSAVTSAGTYIGDAALKAAKKAVDSNSPAKKFIQLGKDSDAGLAIGLLRYSKEVTAAGGQVASVALTSLQSALRNMGTLIDDNMDLNPVITPILDLKNIQNGTNALGQMLNFTPRTALSYAGVAAGTNYSGINTTVNMTIYGAEGQDVNALADIISHKIDTKVMRRQNTWR